MALLPILKFPDPRLRKKAAPVIAVATKGRKPGMPTLPHLSTFRPMEFSYQVNDPGQVTFDRAGRVAHREDLGVRGRIVGELALVVAGGDHSSAVDDDRTDGNGDGIQHQHIRQNRNRNAGKAEKQAEATRLVKIELKGMINATVPMINSASFFNGLAVTGKKLGKFPATATCMLLPNCCWIYSCSCTSVACQSTDLCQPAILKKERKNFFLAAFCESAPG